MSQGFCESLYLLVKLLFDGSFIIVTKYSETNNFWKTQKSSLIPVNALYTLSLILIRQVNLKNDMSHLMTKPTKWPCTQQTQISLGICSMGS